MLGFDPSGSRSATFLIAESGGFMRRVEWFLIVGIGALGLAAAAPYEGNPLGNETVNYTYDELGRLTVSNTTGGPNNTRTTGTCFDKAGNRMRYDVATATPTPCPTPTP